MFSQLYRAIISDLWLYTPAGGVLVFAGILHIMLRQPTPAAQRGGLLFGVGFVALLATGVFAVFVYSFVRLMARGSSTFDLVWSVSAVAAAELAVWLWLQLVRLWR